MRAPAPKRLGLKRVHGDVQGRPRGAFESVFAEVRSIPRGRVMTYGQISTLLAQRLSPVAVGWALHGCPGDVPWHRVVNASGGCSTDRLPDVGVGHQRSLLESEGVVFRDDGTLDLSRYRYLGPEPARKADRPRSRRKST